MAALVAVMIMVAIGTFSWASLRNLRTYPKSSSLVMLTTVVVVVITHNLAQGVFVGVLMAALIFAYKISRLLSVESELVDEGAERVYRVYGQVFFVSAETFIASFDFKEVVERVRIDLTAAHFWDSAVALLHVFSPPPQRASLDLSGAIGLGAKSELLAHLTELDETHGRMEQRKGKLILMLAEQQLRAAGVQSIDVLHRRGSLVEVIGELEDPMDLIVMGKRGEHTDFDTMDLGSNLERVARDVQRPLLVTARAFQPIRRFAIAFDGGPSAEKVLEYIVRQPLLQGLECHVLRVGRVNTEIRNSLVNAAKTLEHAGFGVYTSVKMGRPDEVMAAYIEAKNIDLLVMRAYTHSRIRNLITGSITTAMIRSCRIPLLLFR